MKKIIDSRGYVGGERNRALTPEQVVWARQAAFEKGAPAAAIRDALGRVGITMSVDSVRRMLRGETYGNVGVQMPRVELEAPRGEAGELVQVSEADVAASAERLQALLAVPAAEAQVPADPLEIMRRLAVGVAEARASTADGMLEALQAPVDGDPFGEGTP